MRDADMGEVIIIEHHRVCGMVTDRDMVVRTLAEERDPATTTLADLCRHPFRVVRPTDSVEKAVRLMGTYALRRVPVVEGGQPVGMVSLGDLAVEQAPGSALGDISAAPPHPSPVAGSHQGGPRDRRDTRQQPGGRSVWRPCGKKPRQKNNTLCRNGPRARRAWPPS
jgi:predicted transcriptional regulator